ncbi:MULTISPECIES: NfeD family protein [Micrococcaceae]|uniref:NfeD family protein n=1 Tax=unclassified Kocuria TaxID=2649579 RepID=UPI0010106969|nr:MULTISPECIES: NfeD family protein [unclassified Kocuria]
MEGISLVLTWIAENPFAVWLIAVIVLAVIEMLSLDFFCLMLSGGSLAATITALITHSWTIQVVVFAVASVLLIFVVRPIIVRRLGRNAPQSSSNVDRLLGQRVEVLETISNTSGLIRLEGDHWTARMVNHEGSIPAGSFAVVRSIAGATAMVEAADSPGIDRES